jgi:hypothetical protein
VALVLAPRVLSLEDLPLLTAVAQWSGRLRMILRQRVRNSRFWYQRRPIASAR